MDFYDEALYLIPPWEDLTQKVERKKDIVGEFKMLFDETFHYFKEFWIEYIEPDKTLPMESNVFYAHLSLISVLTVFKEEVLKSRYDNEDIRKISDVSKSFLDKYILSDMYQEYFKDNKVAIFDIDALRLYDVDTGKISKKVISGDDSIDDVFLF